MNQDDYVSVEELIEYQKEETRDIIAELIEDGSDPDALYDIEHHLLAETMEALEPAVIEAFKLGFEVHDAEEVEEDGQVLLCCEAIMQSALDVELIDKQAKQLIELAEKYDIIYDGWGTFYEGDDAIYDEQDERELGDRY